VKDRRISHADAYRTTDGSQERHGPCIGFTLWTGLAARALLRALRLTGPKNQRDDIDA
jgi:hypothetical protein